MRFPVSSLIVCVVVISACGGKKDDAAAAVPSGPIVGVLELPISLRSKGAAPGSARAIEISPAAINVAGQQVLTIPSGIIAAGDRQGDQIPKLISALASPGAVTLAVASAVPYETVALVLASAKAAGARSVGFQVRPPGGSSTPGWLALDALAVGPKSKGDQEVTFTGGTKRPWTDFSSKWEEAQSACRASPTGSCAFKPESVADGGDLKIILHAAGQGVNVEFFRIGEPPPEAAPEPQPDAAKGGKGKGAKAKAKAKSKKKHKPELIDGVKAPKDVVDEIVHAPPATEALFQFRAQEALVTPSAITETIRPVCAVAACNIVVQAEKATLTVRVLSLLGAAFPDGSPVPNVIFEIP
jgi:hypothetical protein